MKYPELLLASYNANEYAVHEPEGTCLVWNLRFGTTTPEFIFTAEVIYEYAVLTLKRHSCQLRFCTLLYCSTHVRVQYIPLLYTVYTCDCSFFLVSLHE